MTRRLALIGSLAAVVALVAGCGILPNAATAVLDGTSWHATEIAGAPPIAGSDPEIRFSAGSFSGTTGCNTFGGPFTLDAGGFKAGQMQMTLIGCLGPIGDQEAAFMKALGAADRLAVVDGRLTIDGSGGRLVFEAGAP